MGEEEDADALKKMAAPLAAMLRLQGEKGWRACSQLHGELAEVAAAYETRRAGQALLKIAKKAWPPQSFMRALEERVQKASPGLLKDLALLVADGLSKTPPSLVHMEGIDEYTEPVHMVDEDMEPVHMVDEHGNFCQANVDRIINPRWSAPYGVISIVGDRSSGKSYLLNYLFGTKFPVMKRRGRGPTTRGIMMSRIIWPSLLLLDVEGFVGREYVQDTSFEKQATLFVFMVSDVVIVNMSVFDIGQESAEATLLFRLIFQERTKLPKTGFTEILVILRFYDGETPIKILRSEVLVMLEKIWRSVNEESAKFTNYIKVNVVGLLDKNSPDFPEEVTELRDMLLENRSAKASASSFSLSSGISWDIAALIDMATQLAAILRLQGEKGTNEWSKLHGDLAEVATAISCDDPRRAVQTLLKVAKDASSSQAFMRTLEERVSKANTDPLKYFILLVASDLNMTPLADWEPVHMVDEDSEFCEGNVDRIINSSAELSAPNAPYAVISIIGGQGSGKSYLLNRLFQTKFPEMDPGNGRSQRGIMMSRCRCIGSSLLLLDFEGFRRRRKGQDTTFQKQATLFALAVSDLVIVNMSASDIGLEQAVPTLLFRMLFQERIKLPQGFTKILVVVRFYEREPLMETLRSNVQKSLEKIWENMHVEHLKFKDYIEVTIVGLPDKNSPKYPKKVTLLRKLLSNNRSAKVPASSFCLSSSILWDTIQQNKEVDIHQFYPREPIFPSKSSITFGLSSGHAGASSSTHSNNNNLSAIEPRAMTFQELDRITDGFSKKRLLGKGGFAMVYKGVLDDGKVVAVKKLNYQPGLVKGKFENELLNLRRVQHQNIIRLVGYCSETKNIISNLNGDFVVASGEDRALLCLEYMQGGTLEDLLCDESSGLDWEERYKIMEGICQGLKYLHTGFKDPIYHLDLKPANILLDKHRIPKIGDFGLSRLLATTGTHVTLTNPGTLGYMPPEYMHGKEISKKFDVFSLGVIMIQVIAGPEGHYNYKCICKSPQEFIDQVTGNWSKRVQAKPMSTEELLDVQKCIKIALRCVEENRANRPTITQIVQELNMIS